MGRTKTDHLDWWHILQWPLLLASAGCAAFVSYTQQRQLGIDVGWDHPWGLPIILDGLAAATLLSYIRKPATFNRVVSTLVISAAVVGNAQAAIYDPDTTNLPAPLWAVIAWKVLPPVAVFTIAHYIAHERKEAADAAAPIDSDAGPVDTAVDGPVRGVDGNGRAADDSGLGDSGTGAGRPAPRRRATKTPAKVGRGRGPTGPDVDTVAADIRRLGIHSKRQAKQHFRIGDDKVNSDVVVAALSANSNGHG